MIHNINKSKINFEEYLKLKTKTMIKSYTERFKLVDKFLYWFSWFGNAISVFLAFFFLQALFYSSFNDIGSSVIISTGIIIFLSVFELLKRFIFGMFSNDIIKNKFKIFRRGMISFLIGVGVMITGSFYFSLNGAQEFIDNQKVFQEQTETNITTKVDSINKFYFNEYIKPLKNENKVYVEQSTNYATEASKTNYKTKYTNLIDANNVKITNNNELVSKYESKRDLEVEKFTGKQEYKLSQNIDENKSNIFAFILISCLIELVIMIGVYYDKFYTYKVITEYEDTVVNTVSFKKWYKYNDMLILIYGSVKEVGDQIPSSNNLLELVKLNEIDITKGELDKFIKILYYLDILKLDGNRRIINKLDGKSILRTHFDIK